MEAVYIYISKNIMRRAFIYKYIELFSFLILIQYNMLFCAHVNICKNGSKIFLCIYICFSFKSGSVSLLHAP